MLRPLTRIRAIISHMKVSDLGEFGLIELLAGMVDGAPDNKTAAGQQLILGIGDDAAAWQGDGLIQLATVDSLIQDVHFTLETTPWEDLGWRALAANLSDIAAMGGIPKYALISLGLPGDTEAEDIMALYRGMLELARRFGVVLVGGDVSRAPLLVINITIFGSGLSADKGQLLTRSAARPGDKVAVTGYLGGSAAGLELLKNRLQFDAEVTASLKQAFLRPEPRVVEGQTLVKNGVRAAIDISDGLVADLGHICQMSRVGARVETDRVPVRPSVAASFGDRALEMALAGGEDYELLFTARARMVSEVKKKITCPVTVIGEITADNEGKVVLLDSAGQPFRLASGGWEHFKAK